LNTKVAPKIMLINSKLFKVIAKQVLPLLASKCNNYVSNICFSHFNSILTYIACDDENECDANTHALGC
jgi:hypothetical protein